MGMPRTEKARKSSFSGSNSRLLDTLNATFPFMFSPPVQYLAFCTNGGVSELGVSIPV